MKNIFYISSKHLVAFFLLATASSLFAQNTFPDNGNVGIGVSSPAIPLHIKSSGWAPLLVQGDNSNATYVFISNSNNGKSGVLYQAGNKIASTLLSPEGDWTLMNGAHPKQFFASNGGQVGIGTSTFTDGSVLQVKGISNRKISPIFIEGSSPKSISLKIDNAHEEGTSGIEYQTYRDNASTKLTHEGNWLINVNGNDVFTAFKNGSIGIGTPNSNESYKLSVNGSIRAKEIVVESGWADFVFDDDYQLTPLNEVEEFIHENNHLPEIPSTSEVEEDGVKVGEIETLLLQKVEELTLYAIEANKQITELASKIELLEENQLSK